MLLHRKLWAREYLSCIASNVFLMIQIGLALFLINNQISAVTLQFQHLNSIAETDGDTYLYQYAMAACGLFDMENGDYPAACEKIRSLPGIDGLGEIFNTSITVENDSIQYPEDIFEISAMDSISTAAVTYNIKEGRWLNENDRDGEIIPAVLGGTIANRYQIGDMITIDLNTGSVYKIQVVGKLADHCNRLDLSGLMAEQNMYSFMVECQNTIFVNHTKIFNMVKREGFGHSTAHCIVKLNKNADKKFLSQYGKLVSFDEMRQETSADISNFIKDAAVEGVVWTVVIIFGIIATGYLISKRRRYVWGIYLLLGITPNKLLGGTMLNSGITYVIGIITSLAVYQWYSQREEMASGTVIHPYHIITGLIFFAIMMAVSLLNSLYILKIQPKEIVTQTKE